MAPGGLLGGGAIGLHQPALDGTWGVFMGSLACLVRGQASCMHAFWFGLQRTAARAGRTHPGALGVSWGADAPSWAECWVKGPGLPWDWAGG